MKKTDRKLTFEAAMTRLQQIVEKLETGEPTLDESLKLFEEGASLSQVCSRRLDEAEQKIRTISAAPGGENKTEEPAPAGASSPDTGKPSDGGAAQ